MVDASFYCSSLNVAQRDSYPDYQETNLRTEQIDELHFANTTVRQPIYCLGYIDMRPHCQVKSESLSDGGPLRFPLPPSFRDWLFGAYDLDLCARSLYSDVSRGQVCSGAS